MNGHVGIGVRTWTCLFGFMMMLCLSEWTYLNRCKNMDEFVRIDDDVS